MLRSDTFIDIHHPNYSSSSSSSNSSNSKNGDENEEGDNIIRGRGKIQVPTHYTITDFILEGEVPYADRTDQSKEALIDPITGQSLTYQSLKEQVNQVASGLVNRMGLRRGDVLALFSFNQLQFVTILLGAMKVGIVITTVNTNYKLEELKYQLNHSGAKVLVVDYELMDVARETNRLLSKGLPIIIINDDQHHHSTTITTTTITTITTSTTSTNSNNNKDKEIYTHYQQLLCDSPYPPLKFQPDTEESQTTDAIIIYSSGTTGNPKGIVSTHYNMIYSILQGQAAMFRVNRQTQFLMGVTPFYHSYGLNLPLLQGLHRHLTILPLRRFNLDLFLKTIERFQLDYLLLTPPLLHLLANEPKVDDYNLSFVKRIMSAGSPLPLELTERVMRRLACQVEQGYGMTEASSFLTVTDTDTTPNDSVGRLLPNLEAKIVHPDTRLTLPVNERGELWVRGKNNMKGYLNNPEATRTIFDDDGYMNTGDIAHFDPDHHLFLFDRVNDLIRYDHHRTSPSYLENVILKFPIVNDVCVIGVPTPTPTNPNPTRQLPRAYIVLNSPHHPTTTEATTDRDSTTPDDPTPNHNLHHLLATLLPNLNLHLHPHHRFLPTNLIIVPTIYKSPAGKIMRKLVHQDYLTKGGRRA